MYVLVDACARVEEHLCVSRNTRRTSVVANAERKQRRACVQKGGQSFARRLSEAPNHSLSRRPHTARLCSIPPFLTSVARKTPCLCALHLLPAAGQQACPGVEQRSPTPPQLPSAKMPVGRRPLPLGPPLEGASAAMHEAARKGNAGGITRAIRKGADMESLDPKLGETVLMLSARHCDVKNVEVLLKAGASLSTRSVERYTAMHTACLGGNTSIVQRLIKEGAGVSCRTKFGDTPLISGALKGHGGAVELLLEAGADVNAFDLEGRTGLMWAATHGQAAMVSLLLAAGAKHNLRDDKGAQALHNATEHQQLGAIAALLRAGANPNSGRRSDQESPLHMTVRRKLSKAARVLLHGGALADVKDGTGMTPLHCAASDGSTEMVSLILGYIRRRDVDDALCSEGHGPGVADNASTAGQRSRRQQQQEYRGDESSAGPGMRQVLTARNDQGWTALHIAAMVYNVDIVNLLLRHGALETERDRIGETPFL